MIRARADAVPQPDGQDLRQRQLRVGDGPGARARRLGRLRRAAAEAKRAAGCAGAASRRSSNGPAPTCSRSASPSRCRGPTAGDIEIFSATQAMGQGLATTYAQLAVDVFGVPIEQIRIVQGDTDRGTGFGSAGSRSLFVGGSAVQVASERTVDDARRTSRRTSSRRRPATSSIATASSASPAPTAASACSSWRRSSRTQRIVLDIDQLGRRRRPGPTAATSARSRSIRTPAPSRSTATGRSTTSAASSTR